MPVSRACLSNRRLSRSSCKVMTSRRVAGSLLTYCIQVPDSCVHSRGGSMELTMSSSWVDAGSALLRGPLAPVGGGSNPTKSAGSYFVKLSGGSHRGASPPSIVAQPPFPLLCTVPSRRFYRASALLLFFSPCLLFGCSIFLPHFV